MEPPKPDPSDATDDEWAFVAPYLTLMDHAAPQRTHKLREAVNTLRRIVRTGGNNDPARLLALKPDVRIGATVGSGHFHQLEVPQQVTPMISRFLRVAIEAPSA